jgi:intein/homing endonuclease
MKSNKRLKFESLNIDNNYIEYAQTIVKSIEKIEDTIVYDIEVEDVHEYIANGIVTHNTGRLACGTDGKNSFFSPVNFQSLPKPHSHNYHVHKATPEQIANKEDLCGYIFNDDPEGSLGLVEGQDPHLNVRKAIRPPTNDAVIISVDMCLEGGSPVQSKRGYIGISDLKVGDEVFTPDGYVKVIRVKNTGAKVLYKIKTNGQAIYCSEDHPFMINNKCVPANKINNVLTQVKIPTYIEYNIKKSNLFNKFKALKDINSIVEKANYIKSNNLIDDFVKAYNNYTAADTAKMCFIKNSSFRHIINYLNLNDKCNKEFRSVQKQHVFNPFKTSNPTSAYLLGYILGDGNISIRRNNYYTLNITSKDYEHINQIKNIFDDTIKLSEHTKNNHKAWSLSIVDQDVCNDLIKLGIKPRKSYADSTINFEWLGNNFSHFIRGLFDADGCIRIKNSNSLEFTIAGHCSYINEIHNYMNNQWSCYKPKNENINILNKIWSNTDKRDFYKYLYTNATIWLQRKRDIFDEYIINNFHQLPEFEMYDITIDSEDHVYFCNGILTHNCAEELRLAANVYNEPTWINAFNSGQDVHKATAIRIFGEENYCKEARKKAKTANFGILYGSSAYGFHNQFPDMSIEECEEFIDKFKSALPSIETSQNNAVRFGRKNGYVKTYFGRPRRVKYYFSSSSRSMQGFGKRTCMNTQIQGCAGDALKLMLVRLWNELFVPYKNKGVRWIGTIHDEINYLVPKNLINEVAPIIMKCQTIKLPDWPVTLLPDLSIGKSFGELIPFNVIYHEDGTVKELIPQMETVKEKDLHPNDPVIEDSYVPEVEDDYDYMQ